MLEENVPLDSSKQKQFVKSIKGIKRLLKKNKNVQLEPAEIQSDKQEIKSKRIKKKLGERGLVYLSHIPHGFYEHEMTQYFKQFGVVTNARVIRSKRTGNSKGHAFVEFKEPTVAQIVAETMNNYLMGKRLIKAAYIPPEEQRRHAFRKRWNSKDNPGSAHRLKIKKAYNATKDEKGELKRATKLFENLSRTKEKLSELGINYDFFKPVDVPQPLLSNMLKKEKEETSEDISIIKHTSPIKKEDDKPKIPKIKKDSIEKQLKKKDNMKKKSKSESNVKAVKKTKNENQKKGLKPDIKPLKDFIKVKDKIGSSDSSAYEFDSDEYEKMIQNDDEYNSNQSLSGESDNDTENEDVNSDNLESVKVSTKTIKQKPIPKNSRNKKQNVLQKNKRKAKQEVLTPPKMLKLENPEARQKTMKLIKKKK